MRGVVTGDSNVAKAFCEVLGLDPSTVSSLELLILPRRPITALVTMYVSNTQVEVLGEMIKERKGRIVFDEVTE